MKLESLVIVDQHATVNMLLGFVHTARHILGESFIWNILKANLRGVIWENEKLLNKFEILKVRFLTEMKS